MSAPDPLSGATTVPLSWVFGIIGLLGSIILGWFGVRQNRMERAIEELTKATSQSILAMTTNQAQAVQEFQREINEIKLTTITEDKFSAALRDIAQQRAEMHSENLRAQTALAAQISKDMTRIETNLQRDERSDSNTRHDIRDLLQKNLAVQETFIKLLQAQVKT